VYALLYLEKTFFFATLLGKAVVRNSYQSFLYVMLCSEEYVERGILLLQVRPSVRQSVSL
jgi:hypothetical protein